MQAIYDFLMGVIGYLNQAAPQQATEPAVPDIDDERLTLTGPLDSPHLNVDQGEELPLGEHLVKLDTSISGTHQPRLKLEQGTERRKVEALSRESELKIQSGKEEICDALAWCQVVKRLVSTRSQNSSDAYKQIERYLKQLKQLQADLQRLSDGDGNVEQAMARIAGITEKAKNRVIEGFRNDTDVVRRRLKNCYLLFDDCSDLRSDSSYDKILDDCRQRLHSVERGIYEPNSFGDPQTEGAMNIHTAHRAMNGVEHALNRLYAALKKAQNNAPAPRVGSGAPAARIVRDGITYVLVGRHHDNDVYANLDRAAIKKTHAGENLTPKVLDAYETAMKKGVIASGSTGFAGIKFDGGVWVVKLTIKNAKAVEGDNVVSPMAEVERDDASKVFYLNFNALTKRH